MAFDLAGNFLSDAGKPNSRTLAASADAEIRRDIVDLNLGPGGKLRLMELQALLFDQADRYRRIASSAASVRRDISSEHKAIFEATVSRDADLACRLPSQHLEQTAQIVEEALRS